MHTDHLHQPSIARRSLVRLAGAAALAGARPGGARAEAAIEDLMPDFWTVYDRAGTGSAVERGRAIAQDFFTPHVEAYRRAGIGRVDLARWLAGFDPMAAAVRRFSARFPALWQAHLARFRQALPDAAADTPVTLLPSFDWFDARTRLAGERVGLFVGPDTMVRLHGPDADPGILLDHESFHLYHFQVNPGLVFPAGAPLWSGIWIEGLAMHASAVLNPDAPRLRVLLDDPDLAAIGSEVIARVAAELPPRLGLTDGAVRARYLGYGYRGDIPARSGYALGLAIAARAAAGGRDLAALARLPAAEAEALVRREVAALAAG
ncbi:MAG TPA: hypothetical protein VGM87_16635 [Roseomonas sp.]|jgi:hypothetical protein